jgi:hypothetical protein
LRLAAKTFSTKLEGISFFGFLASERATEQAKTIDLTLHYSLEFLGMLIANKVRRALLRGSEKLHHRARYTDS